MDEVVGNPVSLLIERLVYLGIGLFFIAAVVKSVLRESNDKDQDWGFNHFRFCEGGLWAVLLEKSYKFRDCFNFCFPKAADPRWGIPIERIFKTFQKFGNVS